MKFALCQRSLTVWRAPGQVQWLFLIAIILSYQTASAAQDSWPREIQTKEESITIYQPQLESFQGDQVTDRAAVMVQKTATKTPVFGVVWFDSRIVTDRDPQRVEFQDIKVAKIKLPNTPPEQERRSERFTDRQGGRADHVQDQRAHKGERRSRPAAQSRQEASTSARSEPRRSARQAPSLQGRQASHEGMRKGARQGAREPHSVSTREARPQPRAKPAESGHHSPRAQGTERTKNVQRSGGGGFSRGGGSHGGGRH